MEEVALCEDYNILAASTSDIGACGNFGCGFNTEGKCTAKGTYCFGYVGLEENK